MITKTKTIKQSDKLGFITTLSVESSLVSSIIQPLLVDGLAMSRADLIYIAILTSHRMQPHLPWLLSKIYNTE